MITFKELGNYGSLGNQMFQFSVLFAAGKRSGFNIRIPKVSEWYDKERERNISQITDIFPNLLQYVFEVNSTDFITIKEREPFFYFLDDIQQDIFLPKDNSNFSGYFQNYKYFNEYRNDLIKLFDFRQETEDRVLNWLKERKFSDFYIGHIRRGDYLKSSFYHPSLEFRYYKHCESAVNNIDDSINKIYISDDKEFCRENRLLTTPENFGFEEDLFLITQAKYVAIANSTFSWWGAYLNEKANIVIAPNIWFGAGYGYSKINYPKEWETV